MNNLVFRIFGIVLVVVINSEIGASVAYGGDCSGGGTCTDTTTNACIGDVCECATTHFRNTANDACVTKVVFDATCDNAETVTDQCAVANQACSLESGSSYKCLCTADYYSDGSSACVAKKNPDIACDATGQCITNAECDVGGTDKCECNTGYTETPAVTPTMCSGVVKIVSLSYMYVVPILVSMMFLLR